MLTGSSSHVFYAMGVKDFFSKLNRIIFPLYFPNLHEKERRIMKSFLHGRSTLPFNINALTNPNY
jgi:hypothetical protein